MLNPGQICLVSGPSKTGKSSLYKMVLSTINRQELVVRCSGQMSACDIWASALESLDFKRIAESAEQWGIDTTSKIGIEGEVGWPWVAKMMTSLGLAVKSSSENSIKSEIVGSTLSPKHLIPLLKNLPVQLVVEDFHYLTEETKIELFQQWKAFVDEGVSVIVISTTHNAAELIRSNNDLLGRTIFIEVGKWDEEDLLKIPEKGFPVLKKSIRRDISQMIAVESVGLPIITQQICQQVSIYRDEKLETEIFKPHIQRTEVKHSLKIVAANLYSSHQLNYDQLSTGPRKSVRKYPSYEKILAAFALDPVQYSLKYHELNDRIASLRDIGEKPIPSNSIIGALNALGPFQDKSSLKLVEWIKEERTLYISEPSFLFFLRQILDNSPSRKTQEEKFEQLILMQSNNEVESNRDP